MCGGPPGSVASACHRQRWWVPRSETARRCRSCGAASSGRAAGDRPRFHRQQAFALQFLAGELAGAADGFPLLPGFLSEGFS